MKRSRTGKSTHGGKSRMFYVERAPKATIHAIIAKNDTPAAVTYTDESYLHSFARHMVSQHETVKHGQREYVRDPVHTNTVEGYFSVFKQSMKGVYQHCSEHHLHRYATEFNFRYSNRVALGWTVPPGRFAAQGAAGKGLTYNLSVGNAA